MSGETGTETFHVAFGDFEGALDLVLHLVRRHEMPIEKVPLAQITAEYLETLEFLSDIDIEPAGEFLEVAATLLRIKARSLLPRPEVPEDPEAAAAEEAALLQQLVEHQVVRIAADRLRRREAESAAVWFRGEPEPGGVEAEDAEVVEADLFALVTAFRSVLAGVEEPEPFAIRREEFTVAGCADDIRLRLESGKPIPFLELFEPGSPRGKLIATFLALLELIRSAEARAFQDGPLGAILIFPVEPASASASPGAAAETE